MWSQLSVDVGWMKNSQDASSFLCECKGKPTGDRTLKCSGQAGLFCVSVKVNRPVTEHLSAQGRLDSRGGLHCFWYQNQTWSPPLGASDTLIIVENGLERRKLQPPQVPGVKNSKKNKPPNIAKAGSQTSKIFPLTMLSVAIKAPRWFVELQSLGQNVPV
jgi:hypothetical protein